MQGTALRVNPLKDSQPRQGRNNIMQGSALRMNPLRPFKPRQGRNSLMQVNVIKNSIYFARYGALNQVTDPLQGAALFINIKGLRPYL